MTSPQRTPAPSPTSELPPMRAAFIAIEGPTGVGKSTLATRLAPVLCADLVLDPFHENPFLPQLDAQHDDPESALRVELTFVALRIAQLRHIGTLLAAGVRVITDWALLKQTVFAATTLGPTDAARIAATVQLWAGSLPKPDVLIGLSAPPHVLHHRVRQRAREIEVRLSEAELAALSAAFDRAIARWDGPLIHVDTTTFDVLNDQHIYELASQLRRIAPLLEAP